MSVNSKTNWLRGFLESLEYSDNISQRQIKILKEKLEELLEEIEMGDFEVEDEKEDNNLSNQTKNISFTPCPEDDLPF